MLMNLRFPKAAASQALLKYLAISHFGRGRYSNPRVRHLLQDCPDHGGAVSRPAFLRIQAEPLPIR
jgi:hypothetical protein